MLKQIQLTNFRKHTNTTVDFTPGLTVLRGSNEAGKTTIIEAACYALFGVKLLREPLEATVTYDEPVNSLKVVLTLDIDGVEYTVKRGKSGAEVTYDGGRVTGQTETTKFLCSKMNVDADAAQRLMLSSQGEIRGALEAGTKATTDLIERLAEFDQIDLLIERMQDRLTLGNTATAEATLAGLQERLEQAKAAAVAPDTAALEAQISAQAAAVDAAQAALAQLDVEVQAAQDKVDEARARQSRYDIVRRAVAQADERLAAAVSDEKLAQASVPLPASTRAREAVQADVDAFLAVDGQLQAYNRVKKFLGRAGGGDTLRSISFAELKVLVAQLTQVSSETSKRISNLERDKAVAQAGLTAGSCGFCGQDFSDVPAVAAKNAQTQQAIDDLEAEIQTLKSGLTATRTELTHAQALVDLSAPGLLAIDTNGQYLRAADSMLPPLVEWAGTPLDELQEAHSRLAGAAEELRQLDAFERRHAAALAKIEQTKLAVQRAEAEAHEARVAAFGIEPADVAGAQEARAEVQARRNPLQAALQEAQASKRDAEYALRDAVRAYEQAKATVASLESQVSAASAALKAQEFNNALLKRVRACRPVIADKLWTIVLSAVSSYFSEMRGGKSRVTKDLDGFKVDGHPIGGLSGSTLDILGLAIRVALVRTFLPNVPFLVLDEPCAAMDQSRTESTLGFIVSAGFKQVVVVTHEDTSEAVADRLIQI